jgi:hypothetical protein
MNVLNPYYPQKQKTHSSPSKEMGFKFSLPYLPPDQKNAKMNAYYNPLVQIGHQWAKIYPIKTPMKRTVVRVIIVFSFLA